MTLEGSKVQVAGLVTLEHEVGVLRRSVSPRLDWELVEAGNMSVNNGNHTDTLTFGEGLYARLCAKDSTHILIYLPSHPESLVF